MAQNAILRFMQGNQLLIMKGDNKTVAAGLVGGDYPLWIGATTPADAPYKVSIDGKLYATGAVISGDSTFEGTMKGVSGSFKNLNCINSKGDIVGGISFGSDGKMWFQEICIIREAQMGNHRVFILMTYGVEVYLVQEKEP